MRHRLLKTFAVVGALAGLAVAVQWMPATAGMPQSTLPRHIKAIPSGHANQLPARRLGRPADLRTASFYSRALVSVTHVHVLLPDDYASTTRRYPVLYLLAGHLGNYLQWATNSDIVRFARRLPLIVVMPDGEEGWYANPVGANKPRWEDYHIGELIPYIDSHYRTIGSRDGRAIAGPSMGGLGAFTYAARHPDLFVAAASFSGFLNLIDLQAPYWQGQYPSTSSVFGDPRTYAWSWQGHDPVELASNLRGLRIYLASGNGQPRPDERRIRLADSRESYCHASLNDMAAALSRNGIPATVDYYGLGIHTWPHFTRDLHHVMPLFLDAFAHPPAQPTPWSYHTTDDGFSVWGYQGVRTGGRPGWTYLDNVSVAGFSAAGTGLLTLQTASLYHPGASYAIDVDGARQPRTAQADAAGRLSLTLTLTGLGTPHNLTIAPSR